MDILQTGRLALIPKTDGEQQAQQQAPAQHAYAQPAQGRQAQQQAPPVDFRPLGNRGSIMRVIGTALATQEGSEVGRALAPLQLAVRITGGACILVAVAQATYTHGQPGEPGCDMLKIDLMNA